MSRMEVAMDAFEQKRWIRVMDVWRSGQTQLPSVQRYSGYMQSMPDKMREQNTLQHSYAASVLAGIMCPLLESHGAKIDVGLLLYAILLHDHGEGELRRDVMYKDKCADDDLNEYHAFVVRYHALGSRSFAFARRAYLLQYASRTRSDFPEDACAIMEALRRDHPDTVMAFYAVERWDYMIHAIEHFRHSAISFSWFRSCAIIFPI